MLPLAAEWRWLTERDDSPWYPTAHLFCQRRLGDWDEVMVRVGAALGHEAARQEGWNASLFLSPLAVGRGDGYHGFGRPPRIVC
jgi:hypothetical protein